jgi:BON domain-containing protein
MTFCTHTRRIIIALIVAFGAGIVLNVAACGGDVAADKPTPSSPHHETEPERVTPPLDLVLPRQESEMEGAIRKELSQAIQQDPLLKDRQINFIVDNGDLSVSGVVRTEIERQRINELAMAVPGVKSVANGLRVLESFQLSDQ